MFVSLGKKIHYKLLSIFKKTPHILGRFYAIGMMLFTVVARLACKLNKSILTSGQYYLSFQHKSRADDPHVARSNFQFGSLQKGKINKKVDMYTKNKSLMSSNLLLALIIASGMTSGIFAIKLVPLSVYAIILNLKPIMVVLIGVMVRIETMNSRKLMLVCISFLGAGLIINPSFFENVFFYLFKEGRSNDNEHAAILKGSSSSFDSIC